jgi:hypothetical protein
MGVHYVNASLIGDSVDIERPQAIIYEPKSDGKMELIAVEYIADPPRSRGSSSISPARQIATASARSTSCTSGPGDRIRTAHSPT